MFVSSPFHSKTQLRRGLALALVAAFAALSAAALLPQVASAITKIKDVRVAADSDGEGAGEAFLAEEGAESVFVLFDYTGASRNSQIAVRVVGSSLELFEEDARYEGDGTAAVEITGDAVYATLAESLEELAAVLLASSNQVQRSNVSAGQLHNDLNVMIARANAGSIAVPLLEKIDDTDVLENVTRLDEALGRLSARLDDARNIAYDDVGERQVALSGTADDARELEGIAEDIALDLKELQNLPLPMMGSQWSFDVSVRVTEGSQQDIAAGDASFYVVEAQGQSSNSQVGGEPVATATSRRPLIGTTARSTRTPPATESASGSQPTATTAKSADDAGEEDESGSTGDDGPSNEDDPGVRPSATPRPGATAAPVSASEGSDEGMSDEAPESDPAEEEEEPPADAADEDGGQNPPVESDSSDSSDRGVDAPPTWTPAAGVVSEADGESVQGEAGSGPNRAVLLLGVLVLIGAGLWFRRRL